MSHTETDSKRNNNTPDTEAYGLRLQRVYIIMLRSYLRRHQQLPPIAPSQPKK